MSGGKRKKKEKVASLYGTKASSFTGGKKTWQDVVQIVPKDDGIALASRRVKGLPCNQT